MDTIQAFVKVVGAVEEKKLTLTYEGTDEKNHRQTVTEKNLVLPELEGCSIRPVAFNREKNEEQMWLIGGERENVVAAFEKVAPLTLAQAGELSEAWGGPPSVKHFIVDAGLKVFQPKE